MDTFVTEKCEIGTIRELIDQMASTQGEATFLISPETGRILTFAGLQQQARAISARLLQAGLERGDKVAFLLENGLFTVQLFLGTMYGGLVVVPLNLRAGAEQLTYTLDHCDAKAVFVEDQYAVLAQDALLGVTRTVRVIPADVDSFASEGGTPIGEKPLATPAENDIALLMYTSGSVGQPKAAIHSHRTILAHGRNSMRSHQLSSNDRSLLVLPLYHINAECVTLMPTLFSGGSVVVPHHFNVSQFWDWLDEYRCTWSAVVPTIISQLLDWKDPQAGRRDAAFKRIRFLRSSSAPLSPSLQREFLDKFRLLLIQAMGSSEAGNIFSNPQPPGENKIGTPGLAWGFETRIIDAEGADVATGVPGEVLIRGPAVMQGYYKDPEQSAAVLDAKGWLHTGDLAYRDPDGYFFIVGRSKELIIKGGMNIAPRQIDEVLESHPAVLEAAVVGVPDHYLGEDLVAFAVLRSGMQGDEKEMLAFCESRLGPFKTPTRIRFVKDLPKGPSGKVQRLRLLDATGQPTPSGAAQRNGVADAIVPAAASTIEQTISQSWAAVLQQPRVNPDSNFFALGGHSLMALQCLSRMRAKLPVVLSLSDFFENPTVAQQVALVHQRVAAVGRNGADVSRERQLTCERAAPQRLDGPPEPGPIVPRGRNLPYPLSPGQQRIWFFEEMLPGIPLYNEFEALRLVGELDADLIERAINLIVERHEVLRTTIQMAAERHIAIVHESWSLRMKRIDLSGLTPAQREAEVERLLIDEPRSPYHLETEPGIRATLVRLGPSEHVFILMMHHLICDQGSLGVFWRELSSNYRVLSHGEQPPAGRLPIQYGDYAVWQQQRADDGDFAEDLAFWRENLRGAPDLLGLPSDRPRPKVLSYRGARHRLRLSPTLTEAIRDYSRREKTSVFIAFTAALNALLYRYTGNEDIPLGVPLSDRDQAELQAVFGFLLHTHVLRTQLSGDMTFRELFARVQRALLALYNHREVPFDQVVKALQPERSLSHTPLFQVMLIWRDSSEQLSVIGMDGLEVETLLAQTGTSKFDLTIFLTDFGSEIWVEAEYSTDLFDKATIQRWLDQYVALLAGMAEDSARPISALPLLSEQERERLIVEWNNTRADFPATRCVHHLIEEQTARTPDRVAVVCEGNRLTYAELNRRADLLAAHLRRRGVKAGVLVGVMVERSLDMIIALLGVMKSGGAYVPIDPAYPPEHVSFVLDDAKVPLLLTQEKLTRNLPVSAPEVVCLDRDWGAIIAESKGLAVPPAAVSADDLAYVIYTSGSTGQPKGVEIPHRAVVNLLSSMRKKPGLASSDILAAVTTFSFDIAALELFLPLCVGAQLVMVSRDVASDGTLLLERLLDSGATVIQATPITFRLLMEAGWNGKPAMKVLCGGEALPRELAEQILKRSTSLWNMYGPTETTIWSSAVKVEPGDGPVPIGGPIENTQFHVLDAAGQLAPIGVPGELHIGGVGLARGYLNRPELTAEKFIPNALDGDRSARLYKTGDLMRRCADGSLEFLGRLDNQVKLRGFRIELGEIEARLRKHAGVGECVVVAWTDERGDRQLVAYLVPLDPQAAVSSEQLRSFLKEQLPEYMVPTAFVALGKLPMTSNGKIDRKALPARELGRGSSVAGYVAPHTPLEETLADIWKKVFGLKQVGVRDNFFALGGHSLLAMRLISEVRRSLNHKLSVPSFFQNPTIEGMARVLQEETQIELGGEQKALRVVLRQGAKSLAIVPDNARWVALQTAEGRPPFFIVDSFPYFIDVVKLLGADQPVLSLADRELQESPSYSIAAEAAVHVQTILECQPQGPYMVGGCSASGIVAYEVAQQLQDRGDQVGLLTLFDTVNPYFMREYSALRRSLAYQTAALKQMRWSELPGWMAAKLTSLVAGRSGASESLPLGGESQNPTEQVGSSAQFGLTTARITAARKYRPKPYTGRFLLFKRHRELGGRYLDARLGWGDAVRGKIEVCQLSTNDHLEIFKSEIDRTLVAQKLRSCFDEVGPALSAGDFGITINAERRVG